MRMCMARLPMRLIIRCVRRSDEQERYPLRFTLLWSARPLAK